MTLFKDTRESAKKTIDITNRILIIFIINVLPVYFSDDTLI